MGLVISWKIGLRILRLSSARRWSEADFGRLGGERSMAAPCIFKPLSRRWVGRQRRPSRSQVRLEW